MKIFIQHCRSISEEFVCAGAKLLSGEDPEKCQTLGGNDSGGPLVCPNSAATWTIWGIVSCGDFCNSNNTLYTPGVYTNVGKMMSVINQEAQNLLGGAAKAAKGGGNVWDMPAAYYDYGGPLFPCRNARRSKEESYLNHFPWGY